MIRIFLKHVILFVVFIAFFSSCRKKEYSTPTLNYDVLVCNEGVFNSGFGYASLYNSKKNTILVNPFLDANGANGGNILQSAYHINAQWWLLFNNSNEIIIVDDSLFKVKKTLTNLQGVNTAVETTTDLYVGTIFNDKIYKINKTSYEISEISTPYFSPVSLTKINDNLYIACSDTSCKEILVYNITQKSFSNSLGMNSYACPTEIINDGNDLYVLSGNTFYGVPSALHKYSNGNILSTQLSEFGEYSRLHHFGSKIYLLSTTYSFSPDDLNGIYAYDKINLSAYQDAVINPRPNTTFYNMNIHPVTGEFYLTDAKDFNSSGEVFRFDKDYKFEMTFYAGIIPSFIAFK